MSLFTVIQTCLNLSLFFLTFHPETLRDPFNLPPKLLFVTTFVPSAWLDDALIAERKAGLTTYLCGLLASKLKHSEVLNEFLSTEPKEYLCFFDMEDALPSTLFRKAALASTQEVSTAAAMIAAAYYHSWSASTTPPEKLDFNKFDILFYGRISFHLPLTTVNGGSSFRYIELLLWSQLGFWQPSRFVETC